MGQVIMRILVIEDEVRMASFIERGLKEEHYVVDVSNKGEDGAFLAAVNPYDLIVLDVMLPDKNGFLICRELRQNNIRTPILLLTARDSVKDKVTGLDAGADDYLPKPFAFEEFLARVRALCRRKDQGKATSLRLADLELDQLTHKVKRAGKEITLTPKEYALLEYLLLHVNEVVTRTMIAEHVWNEDFDSFSNVFDVYVYRLRAKIDQGTAKPLVHSLRGVGYILKEV
jgi:two-component system, OmpR family, copper resistance phosphate regulon response regulator CusR